MSSEEDDDLSSERSVIGVFDALAVGRMRAQAAAQKANMAVIRAEKSIVAAIQSRTDTYMSLEEIEEALETATNEPSRYVWPAGLGSSTARQILTEAKAREG